MTITVSEDLSATPRSRVRFCATLNDDTDMERAGFGSSERAALYELARALDMHPATLAVRSTIERAVYR